MADESATIKSHRNLEQILPDGAAASLMEHTPIDGHAALGLFSLIDRYRHGACDRGSCDFLLMRIDRLARENAPPTNGELFHRVFLTH
jgi:hypothetical protein